MAKEYIPNICWLKVTDYMLGWLEYELSGSIVLKGRRIVCVMHLKGAREILREMDTVDELTDPKDASVAMSATCRNIIEAGMKLDAGAMERMYGMNRETLRLFVPLEVPEMCITGGGVLRPWTNETCFSKQQASRLLKLLREEFWQAVSRFAEKYAGEHRGERYAQEEMVEAFCELTKTDDIHVPTIRREWQRRLKRSLTQ